MRILFVIHQFFPEFHSGTERVALNLARNMQRAGHYVHVLACTVDATKAGAEADDAAASPWLRTVYQGVPVTFLPRAVLPATADFSLDTDELLVRQLMEWLQRGRFDLAHVMHTMRMASAVLAIQRCALPYMISLTDFFLPCAQINLVNLKGRQCAGPDEGKRCAKDCRTAPWTEQAYASRFARASSLLQAAGERVAPSDYVARRYRETFPGMEIRVLPHGIDILALAGAAKPTMEARQTKPLRLVFIGTIIAQKGADVLLKAMARLPTRAVSLKLIGGFHGDPAYHEQVRKLAAADPRVEIAGPIEAADVFAALAEADLLCLPSRVPESFSLVLHEASAAGVPALVSDLGAPAEHVAKSRSGRVVVAGDVAAWAEAITEAVDSPEALQRWKQNLPLPLDVAEEAFFYESLYRRLRKEQPAAA
ncbi:MAG: glycosyltransferase [Betaproteobacteria bacterium]